MRLGGYVLALLLLAGCSAAPAAPPAATSAPGDAGSARQRVTKARVPDDVIASLGYRSNEDEAGVDRYPTVMCPTELATDRSMSTARDLHRWLNTANRSQLVQRVIGYSPGGAAAETVALARKSLDCGTFQYAGGSHTVDGELALPALGGDAQFSVCFRDELGVECELLLSRGDLLTTVTYLGPDRAAATTELTAVGRSVAGLLGA
ncbi:hypothetical protein [Saccharothrix obliqua]|uniref:hypothetical protein n=1 Tax=Saccharothrix obliqua TaxID=2861747 RepID=UPI001C5F9609|nr:hypothetical protein [Saccharothrix obliqua]MBW4717561.1 hypothetical protein [Saccharothrix obliqua]